MKIFSYIVILLSALNLAAQNERAIDLSGSKYVVVKYQDFLKNRTNQSGIKFINSETGQITTVSYDEQTSIKTLEHVKLDSVSIDAVLVITNKFEKKNTGLNAVGIVSLYSLDGQLMNTVLLDNQISDFVINRKTGRIILILHPVTLKSNLDDMAQIEVIYDLKTLKKI